MAYPIAAVLAGSATDPCCCEPPEECCLYPAIGVQDGGILFSDLPSNLVFTIDGSDYVGTLMDLGDRWVYQTSSGPVLWPIEYYFDGTWVWNGFSGSGNSDCLIFTVADQIDSQDQFPDTLSVVWDTGDEIFSATINRETPCLWSGTDEAGNLFEIVYIGSPNYWWQFQFQPVGGGAPHSGVKIPPQDTPIGTYDDGAIVS